MIDLTPGPPSRATHRPQLEPETLHSGPTPHLRVRRSVLVRMALTAGVLSLVVGGTGLADQPSASSAPKRASTPIEKISPVLFSALGAESSVEMLAVLDRNVDLSPAFSL